MRTILTSRVAVADRATLTLDCLSLYGYLQRNVLAFVPVAVATLENRVEPLMIGPAFDDDKTATLTARPRHKSPCILSGRIRRSIAVSSRIPFTGPLLR